MFDELIKESQWVQGWRQQGKEEGEVQALQRTLVDFVKVRFPELTELAQKQAILCSKLDVLSKAMQQLFSAPDSKTAQQLLKSISEQ